MTSEETAEAEGKEASAAPSEASAESPAAAETNAGDARTAETEPPVGEEDEPKKKTPSRFGSSFALGFSLAADGFLPKASLVIALLTTLGAIAVAFALSSEDSPPLASLPGVTAAALAWGAGFVLAVAASARAFDRDIKDGVRTLSRTRGMSLGTYAIGRVFGLAVMLALVVGVGSAATGGVCIALAHGMRLVVLRATLASIAYACAFGLLVAPLAAATLGARSRGRGYLILLALLVIPEALQDSLDALPERWRGLFGIPSAMSSLRDAVTPGRIDLPLAAAAIAVIVVVAFVAMVFAIEQAVRASRATELR